MARPENNLNGVFSNGTLNDVPRLTNEIMNLVKNINREYHTQLPIYDTVDNVKLNYLHEYFELFGKEVLTTKFSPTLCENFNQLNDTIHRCEHALCNHPDKVGLFGLTFDMYPRQIYEQVLEEDKLMLRPDSMWGKLYLGYNTLGKDWLQCIRYNDIDVIRRGAVAPQRRFAAETWINFGSDFESGYWMGEFYRRCRLLPPEVQKLIPLYNLNELTLGRFIIGDIVIDDEFLSFDPNQENWKINNHSCKRRWNHEVFSTFVEVIGFEII
jgi:hypothetical protein